ncbi:MAG: ABC transporter substrate-binding protein [Actinomycetota bacterium]
MVRSVRSALLVALGVLTLSIPVAKAQSTASDAEITTLRVGTSVDLPTDNPFRVCCASDYEVITTEYDMLLKFGSEDLSAQPSLAEGCEPNGDYTEWTCTLREGLTWSDGNPLTSRDVAFSYRFVIDNRVPQYRNYFPFHPEFETPDERTLIWKSQEPTFAPSMPPWVYIVPEHVWGQYDGEDLRTIKDVPNTPAVGSGPFVLTEWNSGESWIMERNPYYWGPEPAVDRIEYRYYSNQEAMVQALRNGEIDIANDIQPNLFSALEGDPAITTHTTISDWWLNLAFNFGGQGEQASNLAALGDLDVRTAIAMAIDKEDLVNLVYQGTATPGDTVIRPASAFWHLDIPADEEIAYDPAAANALLDQAGYADTDSDGVREDPASGEPLEIQMPADQETVGAVEAGQLIVGYLDAIGIRVDLLSVNQNQMNEVWGSGDFDAYIWYWSGDPDPDYQLSVFTSDLCGSYSDGCFSDPAYDRLYEEQRGIMDPAERLLVVQEAQRRLYEQIPSVVLAYPGQLQAYRNDRFTGWTPAPGPQGKLIFGYNYDSYVSVVPVTATGSGDTGGSGVSPWVFVLIATAAVVVVGVVVVRGRRPDDDEE